MMSTALTLTCLLYRILVVVINFSVVIIYLRKIIAKLKEANNINAINPSEIVSEKIMKPSIESQPNNEKIGGILKQMRLGL